MSNDTVGKFETYHAYLLDLATLLKQRALKAKQLADIADHTSQDYPVRLGESLALAGVIALMQNQAEVFGIDLQDINLHDIDHDRDLLP